MICKRCCEDMDELDVNLYKCKSCGDIIDLESGVDYE